MRLVVPYIEQLRKFSKVLYLDNDTVVISSLDDAVNSQKSEQLTVLYDGQSKFQKGEHRCFQLLQHYDMFNRLSTWVNPGTLLFNIEKLAADCSRYDLSVSRMNSIQEHVFNEQNRFLTDQDMLNLVFDYKISDELYTWSGRYSMFSSTCICHYYRLKRKPDFIAKLKKALKKAHKDTACIVQS